MSSNFIFNGQFFCGPRFFDQSTRADDISKIQAICVRTHGTPALKELVYKGKTDSWCLSVLVMTYSQKMSKFATRKLLSDDEQNGSLSVINLGKVL